MNDSVRNWTIASRSAEAWVRKQKKPRRNLPKHKIIVLKLDGDFEVFSLEVQPILIRFFLYFEEINSKIVFFCLMSLCHIIAGLRNILLIK